MTASHLVLGISLLTFAFWLQWTEERGWPNESSNDESDAQYYVRRKRSRRRVNVIFAVCGVLIMVAGFSGPRIFVVAWLLVTLALLAVVILAAFDAIGTQRHMSRKLPELRRQMLGKEPKRRDDDRPD